jgi:hypothetical protein
MPCPVLSAWSDIAPDSEITVSYFDPTFDWLVGPHGERQAELRKRYSFICLCEACVQPGETRAASDAPLGHYRTLRRLWTDDDDKTHASDRDLGWATDLPVALADLATARQILEEQQKWEEIGVVLDATFHVYCVGGKASLARRTAREAMAQDSIEMGPDTAMRIWNEWTRKTRHHGLWNTGRIYIQHDGGKAWCSSSAVAGAGLRALPS